MSYGICRDCKQQISWDEQKRRQFNTRRPLNLDGTIHSCSGTEVQQQQPQQHFTPTSSSNAPKVVIDQDQRTKDIKDAQQERREQHRELIRNMQWLTKAIAQNIETITRDRKEGFLSASAVLEDIGFEEYREEQRSFEDDVV